MFGAVALTFLFQNIEIGKMDIGMEKKVEKDIRDEVANPVQKVYATFSKMYDKGYFATEKTDKSFERRKVFSRRNRETVGKIKSEDGIGEQIKEVQSKIKRVGDS